MTSSSSSEHGQDAQLLETLNQVGSMMREQDADLLESHHMIHVINQDDVAATAAGDTLSTTAEELPGLSLLDSNEGNESSTNLAAAAASPLHARSSRSSSRNLEGLSETEERLEGSLHNPRESFMRRALSGEIWENSKSELQLAEEPVESTIETTKEMVGPVVEGRVRRSESMNRRLNEVAQFAEAVGEIASQNEVQIIEDDDYPESDDDDDGQETVVDAKDLEQLEQLQTDVVIHGSIPPNDENSLSRPTVVITNAAVANGDLGAISPKLVRHKKTRPQWPFPTTRRDFMDRLPDSGATQDFVYKGIRSNPPEIVQSGMQRGNYAQLHRKAWLEVSDKYHRYGKNLRLYYRYWERLGFPGNQFFEWLDSKGEAAGQPLPELDECPRSQLDSDTVLYITNPEVTAGYALKFVPDEHGQALVVDVDGDPVKTGTDGWIFVLRDNVIYGAPKITSVSGHSKERFHHSSFFGGKAVAAAGIIITNDKGRLTRVYPHSGHYRPGEAHMQRMLFFLYHAGVDLRTVDMDIQHLLHVARDKEAPGENNKKDGVVEKRKKVETLHLQPCVMVACFLAHKARFIGAGIFAQIHRIRKADVTSVTEALQLIDSGGVGS